MATAAVQHPAQHRFKELQRLGRVIGIKGLLVVFMAEIAAVLPKGAVTVLVARIAVAAQMMVVVPALKNAVVLRIE